MADPNKRYEIAAFDVGGGHSVRVYLLNPGDHFERFGGSSAGLAAHKTASLIVSESSAMGTRDTEYDLADREVWDRIFNVATAAKYRP